MNKITPRSEKTVTRFAPSPTGYMHIGGVRTALFAWAYAKKFGKDGAFILRIEDTDKEREVDGSISHIIESFKWLGIDWSEGPDIGGAYGPYIQSERLKSYSEYAKYLIDKGLAYADPYTADELNGFRDQAEKEGRPFLYRNHRPENPPVWIDEDGSRLPLRLKVSDISETKWSDIVRGNLSAGVEALDDFILIKSDGYPTYNFAHIIDDLEMGVTHILRADEFISSTPKFLALYHALGISDTRPQFATLPPIMAPDGKKKLGKRDGAKDILLYRQEGYLPHAIINFLAYIGWNPGDEREILSPQEFIELFDLSKVQISGGKFNEEKLQWTNREHLVRLTDDEWLSEFNTYLTNYAKGEFDIVNELHARGILITSSDITKQRFETILLQVIRERLAYFGEIVSMIREGELDYYFFRPYTQSVTPTNPLLMVPPEKLQKNGLGEKIICDAKTTRDMLVQVSEIIEKDQSAWNKESIKSALWTFAEHEGKGVVLWPLRTALSGKEKSPDPFLLAEILGKEEVLGRIQEAVKKLEDSI